MNKILMCMAFVGLSLMGEAQTKGIKFEKNQSWAQIREQASREKKYIFIDVYATWCAPCKYMDSIYKIEGIGRFMNDKFLSVKVQMDSTKSDEKDIINWRKAALEIQKEYKIDNYPTLLFFDPNGKLVHKMTGAMADTTFVTIASEALDSNKQYYTLLEKYKKGKLHYKRMPELATQSLHLNEKKLAGLIADDYINNFVFNQSDSIIWSVASLNFISNFLSCGNKGFNLFNANKDKINEILGDQKAEYAIKGAIGSLYIPERKTWIANPPKWSKLKDSLTSKFGDLGEEVCYGKLMTYYKDLKDWKNFGIYYELYFQKALKRPDYNINGVTWPLFQNVSDRRILIFACDKVMKYAMEEWYQQDANAYDTYANLLYKIGRKDEAVSWERRALKLANGIPVLEQQSKAAIEKMLRNEKTWAD